MEEKQKDDLQKTQIISPGAMGEEANRKKNEVTSDDKPKATAQEEGLNEERSAGTAGSFEGFENAEK